MKDERWILEILKLCQKSMSTLKILKIICYYLSVELMKTFFREQYVA